MKPKNIALLITIAAVVLILLSLSSCRTVHKDISKSVVKSDSSYSKQADNNQVSKIDSTGISKEKEKTENKELNTDENSLNVTFGEEDSTYGKHTQDPVIITPNKDGSFTINPGGRKIKDVTVKQKQSNLKEQSSTQSKSESSHLKKDDSLHSKTSNVGQVKKEEKKEAKQVDKKPLSLIQQLYIWASIILFIALILWIYVRRSKIIGWGKKLLSRGS